MQGEQQAMYGAQVAEWQRRAKEVPGWEEDHSEVAIPRSTKLWCWMKDYTWARTFDFSGLKVHAPRTQIGVHAFQAKSHLNRFIGSVEDVPTTYEGADALFHAVRRLNQNHPALGWAVGIKGMSGREIGAYATGVRMTQEVEIWSSVRVDGDVFNLTVGVKSPYHTVCPFMIKEADGHSHTQRTYITMEATLPVSNEGQALDAVNPLVWLDELNERLTPSMSRMKIPDEAINCLRAYTTPTYTEFGAMQALSVMKDRIKDWTSYRDRPCQLHAEVDSLESIFANNIWSYADEVTRT